MNIDLRNVPFSRNGSYLAFSILSPAGDAPDSEKTQSERPAGLYLRSVHGNSQAVQPDGRMALIEPIVDGRPIPYEIRVEPSGIDLLTVRGTLSLCIAEPYVIRMRGEGVGLRMAFDAHLGDYAIPSANRSFQINSARFLTHLMLTPLMGSWQVDAPWNGAGADRLVVELLPDEDGEVCEGAVEEFISVWRPRSYDETFEECRVTLEDDFKQFLRQMPGFSPKLPGGYAETRRLAAFVNWSAIVEPQGHFLRPAMLMSKNWMNSVWSWDHCFNAMALTYHKQVMAWDQLMLMFDMQDDFGGLPDYYNDRSVHWNFSKPPIHGWVLGWMMERTRFIRSDQIRQIYGPLCRWTEWWFHYRDDDRDGIPQYHHGNDSGWDNATPFKAGVPLESPDLCAFLILQMETLAKLAAKIGHHEEAESWQRRSEELLNKMLAHFWQGDHFAAMRSGDHLLADTDSLFLYLPLILGKRLPLAVRHDMITGLMRPGRFLTDYGLATESLNSPEFDPDGYWRGPVWAPAVLILVEGLAACGETEMARDLARRFCDTVIRSGFAENFDPTTGEGLRDRAYTWTSSIFLVLAREYLS